MQNQSDLAFLSVTRQAQLIKAREISPRDLVDACLARIDRYDAMLRAYITVCAAQARAAALQAEKDIVAGHYRGPLHGIPFGVKDQLCTAGIRTTVGSKIMADYVPDFDATAIGRLIQAGAILIGKETLHEFGKGGTNYFPFGQPRNPWDPLRNPGSSSSGSGIAPAAGFSSGSLGEDTGGSVRGPAAACGVVGLRPTFGRVSRHGGVMYGWTADTIGPITRTVEDNALFLRAIAGHDEHDALASTREVPDYLSELHAGIRGMRLAVVREMARPDGVHPEVSAAFEAAMRVLQELGAQVSVVSLPWARYAIPLNMMTSDADVASMYLPLLRKRWNDFDVGTRTRMATAVLVPAAIYSRAMRARAVVRQQILDALKQYDALLCPTSLRPPALIEDAREKVESHADVAQRLILRRISTHPFGTANVPTLAVPMGFTRDRLPLSLQIAARPFAEQTVYRIGHAYERATPWHDAHPDLERTLHGKVEPEAV
jgi:aspartyl-tRNA(Asn)/glutamyl-tRNA(Gln) amidotransferase subunit A